MKKNNDIYSLSHSLLVSFALGNLHQISKIVYTEFILHTDFGRYQYMSSLNLELHSVLFLVFFFYNN